MTTIELNLNSNPTCAADEQVRNQATAVTKEAAVRLIERLVEERNNWEATVYKTSNDMLYGVLQSCYGFYKTMCGSDQEAKAAKEGFEEYLTINKHTFNKGVHTLVKIVRCVFGNDRRRVSAYSIVLRRALSDGVAPIDLPKFIRNAGGIEEVRLAKSPMTLTAEQRSQIALPHVVRSELADVKSEILTRELDLAKTGQQIVLLATQKADGEITINAIINSEGVLKAAMASFYANNKKQWSTQKDLEVEKSKNDQTADAVGEAVRKNLAT